MSKLSNRYAVGILATLVAGTVLLAVSSRQSRASIDPGQPVSPNQVAILNNQPSLPTAYLEAAAATQLCLENAGLKGVSHSFDAAGKVSFSWGGFATREEAQRAGETYKSCYFANMDDVDRLWQQSPAVEAAATERGWSVMRCIEGANPGVRFSNDASSVPGEVLRLAQSGDETAATCIAAGGTSMLKYSPLPR